jgi:uncharacterized protein
VTGPVPDDDQAGGRGRGLTVLGEDECRALLARHSLGRLGFVSGEGWPVILPVNYVFDEPSIVVRTGAGTKLSDIPLTMVAFEVDAADPAGAWGWSVLAQGPAFDITDSLDDHSESLRHLPVDPRAPGDKPHWLRISARRLSGRRFGEVPAGS